MKVIFRNSTLERQDVVMTTIVKDNTNVNGVKIADFSSIRNFKSIKIRVTLKKLGSWADETMKVSLALGAKDSISAISAFVGNRMEIEAEQDNVVTFTQTFDFSDVSKYPDSDALKFAIVTSDYESGLYAKEVMYNLDYAFI